MIDDVPRQSKTWAQYQNKIKDDLKLELNGHKNIYPSTRNEPDNELEIKSKIQVEIKSQSNELRSDLTIKPEIKLVTNAELKPQPSELQIKKSSDKPKISPKIEIEINSNPFPSKP